MQSILWGLAVIIIALGVANSITVGLLWPIVLVGVPSALLGLVTNSKYTAYSVGLLIGCIAYLLVMYAASIQITWSVVAMHIAVVMCASIAFAVAMRLRKIML